MKITTLCMTVAIVCAIGIVPSADAATFHYCGACYLPWQSEFEGATRHSYTQNYGHVVAPSSGGWVGVRAHNTSHQSYGLNAQNWNVSTHSYSGANLLFMIVGNIFDDGVGNGFATSVNAHGTY